VRRYLSASLRVAATAYVTCLLGVNAAQAGPMACDTSPQLSKSDVTFRGYKADGVAGIFCGNNPSDANALNLWGSGWDVDIRDEGAPESKDYLGLTWTLDAPQAGTANVSDNKWTLSVAGTAFPVTVDIAAVLKGATSWAAYLFSAETFTQIGTSDGTFTLKLLNGGGKIPDLSHMDVYMRSATPTSVPDGDTSVALMLMLGLGLVALTRRRGRVSGIARA
jgi:MYXO-CTERM domain-containing protein